MQYQDLNEFLAKHSAKQEKLTSIPITHTRIPDKDLNIYGGSYVIPKEDLTTFYALYYEHIFVKNRKEYLTEKQLEQNGPMLVDFDFRMSYDVDKRQYSKEHIQDMVLLYLEELKQYFVFEQNKPFDIFIFEKPNVNRLADGSLTKDGIHMLVGIQIDHIMQIMIRDKMLEKLEEAWGDLPLINSWDAVLDEGISKGTTNWQLFGSRKPNNEAYELTQHFVITYDKNDGEFMMDELRVADFDLKKNFQKLSAQYDANVKFEINPKILDSYNKKADSKAKIKKPISKTRMNLIVDDEASQDEDYISLGDITNKDILNKAVNNMLKSLKPNEYEIRELHEYTQVLPEKYYAPGSHLLNRQVAFALKYTDERLFLSWVMLRSKASDFDYASISSLYHDWKKYFVNTKGQPVTKRSIRYWAKQDAFEDYEKVKRATVEHYLEESLNSHTEFDIAQVLLQMYKDKYVCVSYDKKGIWWVFKSHRWEQDKGLSLRYLISTELFSMYNKKQTEIQAEIEHYDENDERREFLKKKIKHIGELMVKLKKTNDKNNIMREAMESFHDGDFNKMIDTNKYLLCFKNGVVDFKEKVFRDGYPQDYITKTTGISYVEFNKDNKDIGSIANEIMTFMEKLFPIADLNRYMWDHLASCLIGTNKNQTFNIYHGSGSNGKSILADLMSLTLGEYKGVVPLPLICEKRNGIGGTSSEVHQLKGVRYAVMQEPKKNEKLNEGTMKELTGGDPLQARQLFQEAETFIPQFKLVVCTNNLFDIESNDDGTWRRIRKVMFLSKFTDENEAHTDDTPYVFPKDKSLPEKLPRFAPIFASMLVKRAFETDGIVEDCETVMNASNKYRNGQDHISGFVSEMIVKTGDEKDVVKKTELANQFKLWFQMEQGNRRQPKGQELYEYMDKKFGQHKSKGWSGVKIIYPDDSDAMDDM